jgi:seryl-tRNA synthetase
MIDLKAFLESPERYLAGWKRRAQRFAEQGQELLTEAQLLQNDQLTQKLEALQAEVNAGSKEIPTLKGAERAEKISALKKISDDVAILKKEFSTRQNVLQEKLRDLPNIPKDDVPDGKGPQDNVTLREWGTKPNLPKPLDYLTIAERFGWIDMERGSKVSGSRFGYILGTAAQLEFALVQYAQSLLLPEGFIPVVPPVLIKAENMRAMGYLSGGGESETYHLPADDLYLVGTAEQAIGPMHRDEILDLSAGPKRYLGFSSAFRREAGSYGKDTKGILRVHQFDKLEMISFTTPDQSEAEHDFLVSLQERLFQGLEIPYRVIKLCTGDLTSFPSARTIDIEAWMPGQGTYRETHSASTTTDFQTRDLNTRVRVGKSLVHAHLLNATAFAIGRTLIALIENGQQPDGSVVFPSVLAPFLPNKQTVFHPSI